MQRAAFALMVLLTACSAESPAISLSCPTPPPTPVATSSADASAPDSGDAGADAAEATPAAPSHFDVYFTPTVGGDVENATLRAIAAWQEVSVGFVTMTVHTRTETAMAKCSPTAIFVDEVTALEKASDDDIALHTFNACHEVAIVYPWPDSASYNAMFTRLGVSPLVPVVSHELGHVLGLPHAASTSHSVMPPFLQLVPVATPTCQDVNALSQLRSQLIGCAENR